MDATVYRYDGSFSGFLCCIYRAIRAREEPALILAGDEMPALLFPELAIHTDPDQARRVSRAIAGKIGPQVLEFAQRAHLTALAGRELYLLALLRRGFREGPLVLEDMADPTVCRLRRAVCHLEREAHLYKGFVRFQVRGKALSAVIQPKNRVLPLLAEHFRERFAAQALLIYDETHREALLCARGRSRVVPLQDFRQDGPGAEELAFQRLWRGFFQAVSIPQRENPLCPSAIGTSSPRCAPPPGPVCPKGPHDLRKNPPSFQGKGGRKDGGFLLRFSLTRLSTPLHDGPNHSGQAR